ncbi:6-phosphogluconolactonase [Pleomorphomonas diazotrophica]|uniref:6-phosphogluconolactonase n=1 Tax=Pleomorphomonas diazotrophica TaxID=1166257 RepID=A0A1I4S4K9_9HYPH|nr:lactonase family protein [Pleomorphomonas diazotrophica]PKR89962.1 6-phosphogluconolactonase [Pleomorphomonas diazotrophica]SFM59341.1 6-phosphogluconolactonase [Pleomorphomonas diazotrophica]
MSARLLIGTYARNGGAGLHSLSREDNGWTLGEAYPGAQNASFGTYSARHDLFYFVNEQAEGALGAFRAKEGGWERLACVETRGGGPCHVALNKDESSLAVANYDSGSIVLFPLDQATGLPVEPPVVRQNAGGGPVSERQDSPHAHCICFGPDQRWLYHVDLGTDEVLSYSVDPGSGRVGERAVAFRAPAGSGPRHLVFHPSRPLALLVSELASTLTALEVDEGGCLSAKEVVTTLPLEFAGENLGGHLSLNSSGDRVYVTNRGHDSVAVFAWAEDGTLECLQHISSRGASPRSFVLLEAERQLLLANEEGGNIAAFAIQSDGTLSPGPDLAVPGAVFLLVAG